MFHAGYDPRSLLRCLLSQLSRAPLIGGLPIRDRGFFHVIHARSKQNYESDSTEILTVAVYENVLYDLRSYTIADLQKS